MSRSSHRVRIATGIHFVVARSCCFLPLELDTLGALPIVPAGFVGWWRWFRGLFRCIVCVRFAVLIVFVSPRRSCTGQRAEMMAVQVH
ncbi:hypothetical protein L210DRAFT_507230 [Boletus edulis BED1]|uniref:Uncharacterized protein n=1 Tax=Boletus edulis BED1 TaxID=1328754 RepID=A0AAD4BV01_BOLED|nr:hypothetical protein L210DRAFT_507230 [Boletus edulis BED1]